MPLAGAILAVSNAVVRVCGGAAGRDVCAVDAQELIAKIRGPVPDLNPLESALAAGWVQDRREDVAAQKAVAARREADEATREAVRFAESQFGQPTAELRRCQAVLGEAEDVVAELRGKLEKAERRVASYRSNLEYWAGRAQLVVDAVERTRAAHPDPDEVLWQRARLARDDADRRGRAELERARARVVRRRGRRGGPSFRSTAATAPAHLADAGCCLYSTDDRMPHDQCWPDQPYADSARAAAVLAEFASHGASRSSAGRHVSVR